MWDWGQRDYSLFSDRGVEKAHNDLNKGSLRLYMLKTPGQLVDN